MFSPSKRNGRPLRYSELPLRVTTPLPPFGAGVGVCVGVGVGGGVGVGAGVEVGVAVGAGVDVRLGVGDGVKVALRLRATADVDVGVGVGAVSGKWLGIGREWPTSATMTLEPTNDRTTATTAKLPRTDQARRYSRWRSLRRLMRRPDRQKRRPPLNNSA